MLRVIPPGLALLYRYYPLTWRILWFKFYYGYYSCLLFSFLYCYGKIQFFIHCNLFCQKYKFTYLLTYFLPLVLLTKLTNFSRESVDVFSSAVQVFPNLFSKIFPLFEQILITYLKCSRASFLLSSYSEKMRWVRGCTEAKLKKTVAYKKIV